MICCEDDQEINHVRHALELDSSEHYGKTTLGTGQLVLRFISLLLYQGIPFHVVFISPILKFRYETELTPQFSPLNTFPSRCDPPDYQASHAY